VHSQGRDVNYAPSEYEEMSLTRPLRPATVYVPLFGMSATIRPESSICLDVTKKYAEL
jgi:hypothetical protein